MFCSVGKASDDTEYQYKWDTTCSYSMNILEINITQPYSLASTTI